MNLSADAPTSAPQAGKVVGIVVAKNSKEITIKPEGASKPVRCIIPEKDEAIAAALKAIFPTNLVEMEGKIVNRRAVLTSIRVIIPPEGSGTVTGIVVEKQTKGPNVYIDVKPSNGGYTERYMPDWENGGWKKDIVAAIAGANVGNKVDISWTYPGAERKRVVGLKIVPRNATPHGPASKPAE